MPSSVKSTHKNLSICNAGMMSRVWELYAREKTLMTPFPVQETERLYAGSNVVHCHVWKTHLCEKFYDGVYNVTYIFYTNMCLYYILINLLHFVG